MEQSQVYNLLGVIGGVSIALSHVPQVIKTFRTKKAGDISYAYQGIYIFGCTLVNIYAIGEGLWPLYVPCLFEESLMIILTIMKFVYDGRNSDSTRSNNDGNHLEVRRAESKPKGRASEMARTDRTVADTYRQEEFEKVLETNCKAFGI